MSLAFAHDAPNGVGKVVGNNQRAARVDGYSYRSASGFTIFSAKARHKINRLSGGATVAEGNEADAIADGIRAVPAAVFADKDAIGKFRPHDVAGEIQTQGRNMRAQAVRIGRINALFTQVQQLWTAVDSFDTPAMQPNPADGEPATLKIYPPLSH